MKWIFALIFFLPFFLSSDEAFSRKIDSIDYRSQQGKTIALIKLSDGSLWKWFPDTFSENMLRKWEQGDEIIIRILNQPGFLLQNLGKPHYNPSVALSFNSYPIFPSITQYENGVIELSNGTKWQLLYDFNKRTLYHWAIGDRIIPVKGINYNFELINLDIPPENRSQIERFIEVEPFIAESLIEEMQEEETLCQTS